MSWEVAYPIGALVLLGVIIWAMARVKTRNRANDKVTEAATREEYDHPGDFERTQHEFRNHTQKT